MATSPNVGFTGFTPGSWVSVSPAASPPTSPSWGSRGSSFEYLPRLKGKLPPPNTPNRGWAVIRQPYGPDAVFAASSDSLSSTGTILRHPRPRPYSDYNAAYLPADHLRNYPKGYPPQAPKDAAFIRQYYRNHAKDFLQQARNKGAAHPQVKNIKSASAAVAAKGAAAKDAVVGGAAAASSSIKSAGAAVAAKAASAKGAVAGAAAAASSSIKSAGASVAAKGAAVQGAVVGGAAAAKGAVVGAAAAAKGAVVGGAAAAKGAVVGAAAAAKGAVIGGAAAVKAAALSVTGMGLFMAFVPMLVGIGLTALLFKDDQAPPKPNQYETVFRIQTALDGRGPQFAEAVGTPREGAAGMIGGQGHLPNILVFNELLELIGFSKRPGPSDDFWVKSGEFKDMKVKLKKPNQPSVAVFDGNGDAICIAYITSTWADGQHYGWVGDWGHQCGKEWYYSNIQLDGRYLKCTWLGQDRPTKNLFINFPHFKSDSAPDSSGRVAPESSKQGVPKNPSGYCKDRRTMGFYHDNTLMRSYLKKSAIGKKLAAIPQSRPAKRDLQNADASAEHDDDVPGHGAPEAVAVPPRLVKTAHAGQNATLLCESMVSAGPDLVSFAEGTFCDMDTRQVWPLCREAGAIDCFDTDVNDIRKMIGARSLAESKSYVEVIDWR